MLTLDIGELRVASGAMLVALAVDRWLGEPPVRLHPVVWVGNYLGWAGRRAAPVAAVPGETGPNRNLKHFWMGALAWWVGLAMVWIVAWGLQKTAAAWPRETRPTASSRTIGPGSWARPASLSR